jgi:hypothetical protein
LASFFDRRRNFIVLIDHNLAAINFAQETVSQSNSRSGHFVCHHLLLDRNEFDNRWPHCLTPPEAGAFHAPTSTILAADLG